MSLEIENDIETVDRSTLERYANCPAQARLIEAGLGRTAGILAAAGNAIHDAIGETIRLYIDSGGSADRKVLCEDLLTNLRQSRPDVQPQALAGFRYSVFAFADWLWRQNFANVLRYDGGQGARSGQLSADVETAGRVLRLTAEVDLLVATASPAVVQELDWKTGFKFWNETAVAESFQFQLHALLIFENYPEVECVRTQIWNTRVNRLCWPVQFLRERRQEIETRVLTAAGAFVRWRNEPLSDVEAWPVQEKCRICPVAAHCPVVDADVAETVDDPGRWVDRLAAVNAAAEAIEDRLAAIVEETGHDVRGTGLAFGFDKPKSSRKPAKALYAVDGEEQD